MVVLAALACAGTVFAGSLAYQMANASDWDLEEVATLLGSGWLASTTDSRGGLHVAFIGKFDAGSQGYQRGLVYGLWNGDGFDLELVHDMQDCWGGISIAVDSTGRAHIAAVGYSSHLLDDYDVIYASRGDDGWQVETLETDLSRCACLSLDSQDRVKVFYWRHGAWDNESVIVMASLTEAGWQKTLLPTDDRAPIWISYMRTDDQDKVHFILDYREDVEDPYDYVEAYAVWDGEALTTLEIPSCGPSPSLSLGPDGQPMVGVVENTTGQVRCSVATLEGGEWQFDVIKDITSDSPLKNGVWSVKYDGDGLMRALMTIGQHSSDDTNIDIICATKSEGVWACSLVESMEVFLLMCASLEIGTDGGLDVFFPSEGDYGSLVHAANPKDSESSVEPFVDSAWLALEAGLVVAVGLSVVFYAMARVEERRRRDAEFKRPFDENET